MTGNEVADVLHRSAVAQQEREAAVAAALKAAVRREKTTGKPKKK